LIGRDPDDLALLPDDRRQASPLVKPQRFLNRLVHGAASISTASPSNCAMLSSFGEEVVIRIRCQASLPRLSVGTPASCRRTSTWQSWSSDRQAYDQSLSSDRPAANRSIEVSSRHREKGFHAKKGSSHLFPRLKRLNRLTLRFSKKLANLEAALAMFATYYNYCRQTRMAGKRERSGRRPA
jgi:hypothetical protein